MSVLAGAEGDGALHPTLPPYIHLCARSATLSRHPVLRVDWLEACRAAGRFLAEKDGWVDGRSDWAILSA